MIGMRRASITLRISSPDPEVEAACDEVQFGSTKPFVACNELHPEQQTETSVYVAAYVAGVPRIRGPRDAARPLDAGRAPRSHVHPALFSTWATAHPALIPHEAPGNPRPYPQIPATPGSKDPLLPGIPAQLGSPRPACHAGGRRIHRPHEGATTGAPIIMATMELDHTRVATTFCSKRRGLCLRPGRHLGTGLGDRSWGSQGPSGLIEGRVGLAAKVRQ
jgi:hypothetical protein